MLDHLHRQHQIKRSIWGIKPELIQIRLLIANRRRGIRWEDVHAGELPVAHARQPLQQGTAAAAQIENLCIRLRHQLQDFGCHVRMQLWR